MIARKLALLVLAVLILAAPLAVTEAGERNAVTAEYEVVDCPAPGCFVMIGRVVEKVFDTSGSATRVSLRLDTSGGEFLVCPLTISAQDDRCLNAPLGSEVAVRGNLEARGNVTTKIVVFVAPVND